MLVVVAAAVPETHPADERHGGGLSRLVSSAALVVRNRQFVGWLLVFGLSMGVIFAYVATSAFVLQSMNGLSPMLYSLDFAFNAVGLTVTTLVAAKLAVSVSTHGQSSPSAWTVRSILERSSTWSSTSITSPRPTPPWTNDAPSRRWSRSANDKEQQHAVHA